MRMLQCAPQRPAGRALPPRRILVVPLLTTKNPTSAGEQEQKDTSTAEPVQGVTPGSRSRRIAALAPALPDEILVWEIFVRLPAKDILRCRVVCRTWRDLASAADFLPVHHQRQPSLPLLTLYGRASREGGLPIFEHGRPVLGFDDNDSFKIHASCDGLLLVSLSGCRFSVCNPATRECAPVPCLSSAGYTINIAAMYLHCPSGEYRVLYRMRGPGNHLKAAYYYYILVVQPGSLPRCIEVPSDISGSEKLLLTFQQTTTTTNTFAPPMIFQGFLHWNPGCFRSNADIVVFDTVAESFSFKRSPIGATRICTRLCDMEGSMGFSCFDDGKTVAKIWVLEDYEKELWSFKYHVKLPVASLCNLEDTRHLVLSHNGDVLVYSCSKRYMFLCDSNGKLLEEFECDPWSLSFTGHWFKESIVKHKFFLSRDDRTSARQPNLFYRLSKAMAD